jgi:pSer/pThr/pTyr-binding forkhead associated (FHA) protein
MVNPASPTRPPSPAALQKIVSAERKGVPFLVYVDGNGDQVIHELRRQRRRMTIGRAAGADLSLSWDDEVSRVHAELEAIGPEWAAVDDGLSTNGTFVNGRRIAGRQRLIDRDLLRIGNTTIAFRDPGHELLAKTVPAGLPIINAVSPTQNRVIIALCRPFKNSDGFGPPATNQQIAEELSLSVDAVKTHLRALYRRFDLEDLQQNQKRAKLAEIALQRGIVTLRDL